MFTIGSRVRIIDKFSMYCGNVGIILGITGGRAMLQLQNTRAEIFLNYIQDENAPFNANICTGEYGPVMSPLELANRQNYKRKRENEQRKAPNQEKVRIVNSSSPYYLMTGIITRKQRYGRKRKSDGKIMENFRFFVRLDGTGGEVVFESFELQKEEKNRDFYVSMINQKRIKRERSVKFHVGANVIVTVSGNYFGEKGVIINSWGFYNKRVKLKNGDIIDIVTKNLIIDTGRISDYKRMHKDLLEKNAKVIKDLVEKAPKRRKVTEKKKEKISLKKMFPEHFEKIAKGYSYTFYLDFETHINNHYFDDNRGTMYYPYEREEFLKLIGRNKNYLNFNYGEFNETLINIIIRSEKIAHTDSNNHSREEIKIELIKMIIVNGGSAEVINGRKENALHVAYNKKQGEIFRYLLEELNVNPYQKNSKGITVYSQAKKDKNNKIVELIEKYPIEMWEKEKTQPKEYMYRCLIHNFKTNSLKEFTDHKNKEH